MTTTKSRDAVNPDALRIALNYRSRIHKTLTKEFMAMGISTRSALPVGNIMDSIIGWGAWGIVFETSVDGWVWKVTVDPDEGPVVAAIMGDSKLQNHPGVAYFQGVWRVPETFERDVEDYDTGEITSTELVPYVILREDITPRPVQSTKKTPRSVLALERALKKTTKIGPAFNEAVLGRDRETAEKEYAKFVKVHSTLSRDKRTKDIADFLMAFVESQGGMLADAHLGNIGTRQTGVAHPPDLGQGKWVFFDPGISSIHVERQIPLIENPCVIPTL